jgi:hypothetical protein
VEKRIFGKKKDEKKKGCCDIRIEEIEDEAEKK